MAKYARFSSDHRVIGIQFLVSSFAFLLLGGALGLALRAEVTLAGANLIGPENYARLFTNHGTVMVFLWLLPAVTGLTHAALPATLGLERPRYPRLGALSFWLMPVGGALLIVSFFLGGASAGWTGYVPLALRVGGLGQTLWALSLTVLILSLALSAASFVGTILGKFVGQIWDAPLFAWAVLTGSVVTLISSPLLLVALGVLVAVRLGGMPEGLLSTALGVALWSNLFWFFAHPATFVMLLSTIGVVSEIVQTFSGKRIVRHHRVALAIVAVGGLGLLSWGHHMVVSGLMPNLRIAFMLASLSIAIPIGYIVFSWIATLWAGQVQFSTPMLFSLGTISILLIGGVGGVAMSSAPVAAQLEGSYFEIGTLHFGVFGAAISGLFAGIYYWFPMMVGRELDEKVGKLHFLAQFSGVHMTYLPMFAAGLYGAPTRVFDFGAALEPLQLAITGGALLLATAALMFLYNAYFGWRSGAPVTVDPWGSLDPVWGRRE